MTTSPVVEPCATCGHPKSDHRGATNGGRCDPFRHDDCPCSRFKATPVEPEPRPALFSERYMRSGEVPCLVVGETSNRYTIMAPPGERVVLATGWLEGPARARVAKWKVRIV